MIVKWNTLESRLKEDLRIFKATEKTRVNPVTGDKGHFTVLESSGWVNVIPITADNKIILVEQYRHGSDSVTLEIPGGLIEPNEEPIKAAMRECTEETGYHSSEIPVLTGVSLPNPAFLNNHCYSYAWFGCKRIKEQDLDLHEVINVIELPLNEIKNYVTSGKINHSVILTAFFHFSLKFGL